MQLSFFRFLNRFQQSSDLHKEMLAILSAITEVIKERNGTQSSTEFFLGLVSYNRNSYQVIPLNLT